MKKQEDTKLAELAEKYRDRARERRDDANPDYQNVEATGSSSNAYRAVAPDVKSGIDAAERRKQMIQESKFLGGDMEHTHLVKGLDYALLQKVRSEIVTKELEEEKVEEEEKEKEEEIIPEKTKSDELMTNSIMGRNICNLLGAWRSRKIERNELFAPGRMAYVIDLADEENNESDIPTTLIRSKADVPISTEDTQTLTTNDIVINKLAQILSYLRQGGRGKKNKKRDRDKPLFKLDEKLDADKDISIYDDVGDYKPSRRDRDNKSKAAHAEYEKSGRNYFNEDPKREEKVEGEIILPPPPKISAFISRITAEPEGYAECYPGLEEMNDAIDDSDDEVDYTKMDLGNKKGPIGRWDFDTQEEYSDYMSTKEALPKAAFQYGVKMQDGRKTRKHKTEKNEKAELDREWQKIQNIIQKRKGDGGDDGPSGKSAKY